MARAAYILNEVRFRDNLELLKRVQDEAEIDIIMALKAMAFWPIFPIVADYLHGATASSLYECLLINKHMGTKAHTYAPVYFDDEIDALLNGSSHIVFNSLNQYHRYGKKAIQNGVSIGLRVNPGWSDVETDKYNPAIAGSRLGIDELEHLPEGVEGLHIHSLCESNSHSLERLIEEFKERFGIFFQQLKWINLGGGHLITDKHYDTDHLIGLLKNLKEESGCHLIMEPGAALAWQAGILQAHVIDIVSSGGVETIMLDVSFTAHMPDCLEMPYNPKIQNATFGGQGKHVYRLGGTTCLAGDFIGPYSFEKKPEIGAPIIFEDMFHYTMVKTSMFNGVRHPDFAVKRLNGSIEIVKRFEFADFESRMG